MKVLSLFSGIGGLDHGLERAGHETVAQCESDPWRREILRARFGVPVAEDVQEVAQGLQEPEEGGDLDGERGSCCASRGGPHSRDALYGVGVLVSGFPCQDVSVAGKRKGLQGERTGLFWEFVRIARSVRPPWILLENVPGLLSSHAGRDFREVLGALVELGYGVAWRILDSRFFGVPQRRRRVFILGALADGDPRGSSERAATVLAVGSRCERHPAKGQAKGQDVAGSPGGGSGRRGFCDDLDRSGAFVTHSLRSEGFDASEDGTGRGTPLVASPLSHGSNPNSNAAGRRREDDENLVFQGGAQQDQICGTAAVSPCLAHASNTHQGHHQPKIIDGSAVRRLTPTECERLQGLPDGWTLPGSDSKRYAALGDAVTASVAEWIGRRLMEQAK